MRPGIAAVVALVAFVAGGCGGSSPQPSAAEQVPRLSAVLHRIDTALAAHHFAVARQQLRVLKADVVAARAAGELDESDAQRIMDAVAQLLTLLPASAATPSPSALPQASATSASAPSSPRSSSRPTHPRTTAPSTSVSPSVTPSSSPTTPTSHSASPTASPTGSATRDASMTSSASPTP